MTHAVLTFMNIGCK